MRSTSLNTTTEALDPGEEIEYGTSPLEGGATQLIESNVKMGVVYRMRVGENLEIPTQEPKGSHAIARNDETKQGTDFLCDDSDDTDDMTEYNQNKQLKPLPQSREGKVQIPGEVQREEPCRWEGGRYKNSNGVSR